MASCSSTKLQALFELNMPEAKLTQAIADLTGLSARRSVPTEFLHLIGERYGFLKRPLKPTVVAVFVTKGGVLKTTLTLNLARVAALHNIRTCVVGLDMQGDVTAALGAEPDEESAGELGDVLSQLETVRGLSDVLSQGRSIESLLQPTDLPALWLIPETPELVMLNQQIQMRNRREYWLKECVIEPLKTQFDLILLDCSPNWNHLTTNALVACDALVSPLECKIHNFRNLKFFRTFVDEFRRDLGLKFKHCFVPTKFSLARKLSRDILVWYQANIPGCIASSVREGLTGEEACALHQSLLEYAPKSPAGQEMRQVLKEIWIEVVGRPAVVEHRNSERTCDGAVTQ